MNKATILVESENLELFHSVINEQYRKLKDEKKSILNVTEIYEFNSEQGIVKVDEEYHGILKEQLSKVDEKIYVVGNVLDQIEEIWSDEE